MKEKMVWKMGQMTRQKTGQNKTLLQWLIELIDTPGWRSGAVTGEKHPRITQKEIDLIGREALLLQAGELERQGLIRVTWREFHGDIEKLDVSVDAMGRLCALAGVENPRDVLAHQREEVEQWKVKAQAAWLEPYYAHLLERLSKGEYPRDAQDANFFRCLNEAVREKEALWKRAFSAKVLKDSKLFEQKYEDRVLTVLTRYSPKVQEGMTGQEILAEHGIETYSQILEIKGPMTYRITNAIEQQGTPVIDTASMIYGTVLNAQTLAAAEPVSLTGIRTIMTIENKANYESMSWKKDTLYIYCHGFFSPKERCFLRQLCGLAEDGVMYYHWGDMDYGGIRIYHFNKTELFPEIQPYCMDVEAHRRALEAGSGIPLEPGKRKKLKELAAGDLEGLKEAILLTGMEIEQESFLTRDNQESKDD